MSRAYRKNGIPDRWLDYQAVGKRLPGSRFIAFKVPLKLALTCRLSSADVFGPWELLDTLTKDNQELGLIIDLTFTTRYYRAEDVPESLQCVKIFTAGHEIPSDETILNFKRAVHRFLHENADNDKLVGVHCTHGLNRTGYLICRYLIDVDGVEPHKAIELFNSSRGHAIERQNYLEDLLSGPKRSNEGIEECEQEPVKGSSTHRPIDSEENISNVEERPAVCHEPSRNRRRNNRHSHPSSNRQCLDFQSPSASGLLPSPGGGGGGGSGLLPSPGGTGLLSFPSFPSVRAPFCNYSWSPPQANYQWRGSFPRAESRAPSSTSVWNSPYNQRDRGNGPYPSNHGPHVSGQWTNDSNTYSYGTPGKWAGPKMRPENEHDHRVGHYKYPYDYQ
ncbi:RNA/RNP complex-1-interacting phosphatase [Eucyclogobius newberryi]|uniref:RNA/RNP complex-1-interacting phosphatase n=1 Tax=Eucyclogobius newberryi TaxID=166745 RepID=UPI003B5BE610